MEEKLGILNSCIDLVVKSGSAYEKDTPECIIYLSEHSNCIECSTQLGCSKCARLMLVMMIPIMYKAKNFEDFQRISCRVTELMDLILAAKTKEELDAIPNV